MWSRKETSSFKDSNSFGSDSISEFSSSPVSNDSIMSSNSSEDDDEPKPPNNNNNNTTLDTNHKKIKFGLNDDETDESVIFAETSNEKIEG